MSSSIIILAAGASRRMGQPKQMLRYGSRTLLSHAVGVAAATSASEVLVVVGIDPDIYAAELACYQSKFRMIQNRQSETGIGSSIRFGIEAISREAQRALLMTCDQPFVRSSHLEQMLELAAVAPQTKVAIAANYRGILGVPVVFRRSLFPELTRLSAEQGARKLLLRHRDAIEPFELPEAAFDVDTPSDYRMLTRGAGRTSWN